ncbi:gamma-glutamyltransferase [Niabella hibiscisoli]|nr:gamma-glutamyltransferase [Niabella hibiscisoli]MCH5721427.1 gamma-glutamyltransferase [Niabella hibiscisoli]
MDYRETAPSGATKDMYLDGNGNAINDKSLYGHLSAGVPGTVAGLFASHRFAQLSMQVLIQPAIELAEKGFVITEAEARSLNNAKETFERYNTQIPVFVKTGGWKKGDTLIQADLANTLKRIKDNGQKGFYEGTTAALIVEEMKRGKGLISLEDLKTTPLNSERHNVWITEATA